MKKLKALQDIDFLFNEIISAPKETIGFIQDDVQMAAMYKSVFKKISSEMKRNENIQQFLAEILTYDTDLFIHSLNVTVYSLAIAYKNKLNTNALYSLAISGLLHDIGKISISTDILYKPGKLTDEEFKIIQKHSEYGFMYLSTNSLLSSFVLLTTLQHHERIDGSGYPQGLTENEIHPFAKIVAIADVFDALTMERCYKKSMTAEKAISLLKKDEHKFDSKMLNTFIDLVKVYPIGNEVILNDARIGIIKEQTDNPFCPIIEVKQDGFSAESKRTILINLNTQNEFSIQETTAILNFSLKLRMHQTA